MIVKEVMDGLALMLRKKEPARIYGSVPAKLLDAVLQIPGCRIILDTIDVKVKDDAICFGDGYLPTQKVTITFDWCGLTEGKEVKFDQKFKEAGYLPTRPAENALDVKERQDGPEGSV